MKTRFRFNDSILMITLGCAKNIVDSERLMRQFSENDLNLEFDEDNTIARTVIINTCGFIGDAKKESIDTILKYVSKKKCGLIDKLIVIGCLVQRYKDELMKEIPEVDGFYGVNQLNEIITSLGYKFKHELIGERIISTPEHYAYLKISEGCNRKCSFCAIPLIRGKYTSFQIQTLFSEASFLASKGVKEIILIAQDISSYGLDTYNSFQLPYLVEKLSEIEDIKWIRLHYAYPKDFPAELLKVMNNNPKVCRYLDIPFQHISDKVLKMMRRGLDKNKTIRLIDNIRSSVPGIALRTSFLVGHPGETQKEFEELVNFIQETKFDRLGTFIYSHEENTYSGMHYEDSITHTTKNKRMEIIMSLQKNISFELNKKKIGQVLKVLIDREEDSLFIGRTQFDSPEIDNEVIIKSKKPLKIGGFYDIKINDAYEYDLSGIKG